MFGVSDDVSWFAMTCALCDATPQVRLPVADGIGDAMLDLIYGRIPEDEDVDYPTGVCESCGDAVEEFTQHWTPLAEDEHRPDEAWDHHHEGPKDCACSCCEERVGEQHAILEFNWEPDQTRQTFILCHPCDLVFQNYIRQLRESGGESQ